MPSEIKYAVQQFEWPTTTGTFDVTIAGLGWTPKACKVTALGSAVNGTVEASVYAGVGFSDGTSQRSVAVNDLNGAASTDAVRVQDTSGVVFVGGSVARLDMLAGTAGPIADGWKINCINIVGTGRKCIIEFFGGADLNADVGTFIPASTGNTSKTGMSFQPNLLMMTGIGSNTANGVLGAHPVLSFRYA